MAFRTYSPKHRGVSWQGYRRHDGAGGVGVGSVPENMVDMRGIGLLQAIGSQTIDHEQNHEIHVGHFRSFP